MIPAVFLWGKKPVKIWVGVALAFFAASNIWRFSPDMFNNHKLINFSMISVQVAVAGFLASWLAGSRWFKAAGLLFLCVLTFSGIVDLFPVLNDHRGELRDFRRSPTGVWLRAHLFGRGVFVHDRDVLPAVSFGTEDLYRLRLLPLVGRIPGV
jgi:hypothetical protein